MCQFPALRSPACFTSRAMGPSPHSNRFDTPETPANPFHAGRRFRGFSGLHIATACQLARPPCMDLTRSLELRSSHTSGARLTSTVVGSRHPRTDLGYGPQLCLLG